MAGRNLEEFRCIGRKLADLRQAYGLTQRGLAHRLGRPPSYVAKLELAERRLDVVDLRAIALALDLPVSELAHRLLSE